ncbi:MAG: DUF4982 domain-containing protein [Bacteroidetes bacterium]|nr:DUF4982 domain-containing protein [Bacteroidota bacterium]
MKNKIFSIKVISAILLLVNSLLFTVSVNAQRSKSSINDSWKFHQGGVAFAQRAHQKNFPLPIDDLWETVSLPHCWNTNDPFDDEESYLRGIGWYRKFIKIDSIYMGKSLFLQFEGANQVSDVYVNGIFAGQHKGGYTGFTFDITNYVKIGEENLIAVQVDNSHDNTITPLSIGFALYGGIYRDVWLLSTNKIHFKQTHYGSNGVYISTPDVSAKKAGISIRSLVENKSELEQKVQVSHEVYDAKGTKVLDLHKNVSIAAGKSVDFNDMQGIVNNPELWSPENPVLYTVISSIEVDGNLIDEVKNSIGFRWFSLDKDKGLLFNGEKYTLKGTNRHQDMDGFGSALSNTQHIQDMLWIKNMGANFVRLAHYPQDPIVLETADKLGLLVWVEIPNLNYIVPSSEITAISAHRTKEMIYQNFNHPSIMFWGSMNELFLWDKDATRKAKIEDPIYRKQVRDFVFCMDSVIRNTDPSRLTTLAIHGSKDYDIANITQIPDMVSVNQYSGWYSGSFSGFGGYLDNRHKTYNDQVLFISEYGAGSDVRVNITMPKRFDFTGKYQRMFHKSYLKQINDREYLVGSAVWSQFDFSQPHTGGSIGHINQKGLQKFDRTPKDVYYFYKANWNPDPMVYIASRDWIIRCGWNGKVAHDILRNEQEVDVYSNMSEVELFHNGVSLGKKQPDELKEASWKVPFVEGVNKIKTIATKEELVVEDILEINFKEYNLEFNDAQFLAINVGSHYEFVDDAGLVWLPDQKYVDKHYGWIEGKTAMVNKDVIILNAKNKEPLYDYYHEGISAYKLNVPNGNYDVELYFADAIKFKSGERMFDVLINGNKVLTDFDITGSYGFATGVGKAFVIEIVDGKGLSLDFVSKEGEALLNGIKLRKIY